MWPIAALPAGAALSLSARQWCAAAGSRPWSRMAGAAGQQALPQPCSQQQLRGLAQSTEGEASPAEAFLSSFVNWEARGIPASAGVGTGGPSGSSDHGGGRSGDSGGVFDLQRMNVLLAQLGNPQDAYPVVHVAGTKGKGSVTSMLSCILRAAGLKVSTYTSPHMLHIRERIQCSGGGGSSDGYITAEAFEQLVQDARGAVTATQQQLAQQQVSSARAAAATEHGAGSGGGLSHFEVVTALALKHFANEGADIAVVEAGLGGATDATNVFSPQRLQAAVITPVGLDHVAALGGSLASIATAKAGIMKPGRPVVLAAQPQAEALEVLLAQAQWLGCPVTRADEVAQVSGGPLTCLPGSSLHCVRQALDISAALPPGGDSGEGGGTTAPSLSLSGVEVQLVGQHQQSNVATALAAVLQLRQQGWSVPDEAVRAGLEQAFLPGRFQVAKPDPSGPYLVLDGAHTADSAAALSAAMREAFPNAPIALVLAMAGDKEHREVISGMRRMAPQVVVFTSVAIGGSHQRSASPGTLAAHWQAAAFLDRGKPFRCRELIQASLTAALEKARTELKPQGRGEGVIVVAGSLHAAAAAAKHAGLL